MQPQKQELLVFQNHPIEYAKNININCVSPGFIKTEMTDKISEDLKKL